MSAVPQQDLTATSREVDSLVHRLRCLSSAGCGRAKALEICQRGIEITKWRNPL